MPQQADREHPQFCGHPTADKFPNAYLEWSSSLFKDFGRKARYLQVVTRWSWTIIRNAIHVNLTACYFCLLMPGEL